jgi:hypothetical protein
LPKAPDTVVPILGNLQVGVVLKKIKIFNFFGKAQKKSKLSENDVYTYLRLFPKYGVIIFRQKKVMRVES